MQFSDLVRLLTLGALWGGSFLFMRVAAPVLGAIPVAFGRVALASVCLLLIVAALRVPRDFRGRLRATLALGAINSGLPFLMYTLAARVLPAGYSAIINAVSPLMGIVIGALIFHDRPTPTKILGVFAGLAGVAVLTRTGPLAFSPAVLLAVGACLLATLCYGLAGYLTKRWITDRGGLDSRLVALGSQIGAVLLLAPFMAWQVQGSTVDWSQVGPVVWGWLFLGEQVSWGHLAGGGLIAVALWLVLRPGSASSTPANAK